MKLLNKLICALMLLAVVGIKSSQELEYTQESIGRLPKGWQTATGLLIVTSYDSKIISIFSINENGSLTTMPDSPFLISNLAYNAKMSADGRYLFVVSRSAIIVFSITDNGSLTEVGQLQREIDAENHWGKDIAISKKDERGRRYLFVLGERNDSVGSYLFTDDGLLTKVGQPVPTGGDFSVSVTISEDGRYLFVLSKDSDNVSSFSINEGDGSLTLVGQPVQTGGENPTVATISGDGRYLFVLNKESDNVSSFSINEGDGSLTLVGQPVPTGGNAPSVVTISGDGRYLFVLNKESGDVSSFSINEGDGSLTLVGQPVQTGGEDPTLATISGDGRYLFVIDEEDASSFLINDDGSLTLVGRPVSIGNKSPSSVLFVPLPIKWQSMQAAAIVKAFSEAALGLPEDIEQEIMQTLKGRRFDPKEFKKESKEEINILPYTQNAQRVKLAMLIERFYSFYATFNTISKKWRDLSEQRRDLSKEWGKVLEEWGRDKDIKELRIALILLQDFLDKSNFPPFEKSALKELQRQIDLLIRSKLKRGPESELRSPTAKKPKK